MTYQRPAGAAPGRSCRCPALKGECPGLPADLRASSLPLQDRLIRSTGDDPRTGPGPAHKRKLSCELGHELHGQTQRLSANAKLTCGVSSSMKVRNAGTETEQLSPFPVALWSRTEDLTSPQRQRSREDRAQDSRVPDARLRLRVLRADARPGHGRLNAVTERLARPGVGRTPPERARPLPVHQVGDCQQDPGSLLGQQDQDPLERRLPASWGFWFAPFW